MASLTDRFGKDPGGWPIVPKLGICVAIIAAVIAVAWGVFVRENDEQFQAAQTKEKQTLWPDLVKKTEDASQLEELKQRRLEATVVLQGLERQLPNDTGIPKVLSDVSDLGLYLQLTFELFKKMPEQQRENFVEQPINIVVSGNFHSLAKFVSEVANLDRIVTLNDIKIEPKKVNGNVKSDLLTMTTVAKIFRYPNPEERFKLEQAQNAKRLANVKK
jgi:type IV pilus assembly protein PilO